MKQTDALVTEYIDNWMLQKQITQWSKLKSKAKSVVFKWLTLFFGFDDI